MSRHEKRFHGLETPLTTNKSVTVINTSLRKGPKPDIRDVTWGALFISRVFLLESKG